MLINNGADISKILTEQIVVQHGITYITLTSNSSCVITKHRLVRKTEIHNPGCVSESYVVCNVVSVTKTHYYQGAAS